MDILGGPVSLGDAVAVRGSEGYRGFAGCGFRGPIWYLLQTNMEPHEGRLKKGRLQRARFQAPGWGAGKVYGPAQIHRIWGI